MYILQRNKTSRFLDSSFLPFVLVYEKDFKNIFFARMLNGHFFKMVSNSPGGNRGCVIGDISRAMGDC